MKAIREKIKYPRGLPRASPTKQAPLEASAGEDKTRLLAGASSGTTGSSARPVTQC